MLVEGVDLSVNQYDFYMNIFPSLPLVHSVKGNIMKTENIFLLQAILRTKSKGLVKTI